MRKAAVDKAATRQRIIDAASALFRAHGIDAVGVDAIMHAAGLTHGGFYGHFASKEALVAEVAAASLSRAAVRWERIGAAEGLAAIVDSYLDPAHVAATERGCVLTTIGPDVARRPEARAALGHSVERMVTALQHAAPQSGRAGALAMLSTLVGAVVLARLAPDEEAAAAVLTAARAAVAGRPEPTGVTKDRDGIAASE
jgi:TetR/AcrR family transcriptional repressor of nem operon